VHHDELLRLCARALDKGAVLTGPTRVEWDVSGFCENRVIRRIYARPSACGHPVDNSGVIPAIPVIHSPDVSAPAAQKSAPAALNYKDIVVKRGTKAPMELIMKVPCKTRCRSCLSFRRKQWEFRAVTAALFAWTAGRRCWLGTLTCTDSFLYTARCAAAAKVDDFDTLDDAVQFRLLDREVYRDVTKYLKRLRKGNAALGADPAQFTFLCVTERHDSDETAEYRRGTPHYHILVCEASRPIRKVALKGAGWPGGFVKFNLLDQNDFRGAGYACKYLAKQGGRLRASLGFGIRSQMDRPDGTQIAPAKQPRSGPEPPNPDHS
jgi:hypothetical protein